MHATLTHPSPAALATAVLDAIDHAVEVATSYPHPYGVDLAYAQALDAVQNANDDLEAVTGERIAFPLFAFVA